MEARSAAGVAELEQAKQHLQGLTSERDSQRRFLETAAAEAASFREQAQACNQKAQAASRQVSEADIGLEAHRRSTMQLLTLAGQARSQTAQAEESLASLEREAERLENERNAAKREAESLGAERGQASLTFESVTRSLEAAGGRD